MARGIQRSKAQRMSQSGGAVLWLGLWCIQSLLIACEDRPAGMGRSEARVSIDTLEGVVWVRNVGDGIWTEENVWTLQEEFRIGESLQDVDPLLTTGVSGVSRGPQGNLFVLDPISQQVQVLDPTGNRVGRFGGSGDGPGEFRFPAGMGWDGMGRLWIASGFNRRYTVFDSTGGLIKTVPRPISGVRRRQYPIVFDGSGYLVDEGLGGFLIRVDTAGSSVDSFPPVLSPPRSQSGAVIPPGFDKTALRYLPKVVWAVAPDLTVWMAESGRLRLVNRSLEGDTLKVIETTHRDFELDSRTLSALDKEFTKLGYDTSKLPLARPVVQAIYVLEDGHLLVQIEDVVGAMGSSVLDVFDPVGRFLGSIDLGFDLTNTGIPAIFGDTIVGVHLDELDLPVLVRATILRNSR